MKLCNRAKRFHNSSRTIRRGRPRRRKKRPLKKGQHRFKAFYFSNRSAIVKTKFMARPTQITLCSFCGKSHAEVKKLIQGPGVYICDNCVLVCKNVLDKEIRTETKKSSPRVNL